MKRTIDNCKNQKDFALFYASIGWKVFPVHYHTGEGCSCSKKDCSAVAKHPLCTGGFKNATDDIDKINAWWSKHPMANIGVATGKASGIIVIDIDPRNNGHYSLEALEDKVGELSCSLETHTGGDGIHKIYGYPKEVTKIPSKNNFREGIDLKADGGYVILPESNHQSKKKYTWDSELNLDNEDPAPPPIQLLNLILERKSIPEGNRNNFLASRGGKLRRNGFNFENIRDELMKINLSECHPPLDPDEVESIAKSISSYEIEEEWDKPTPIEKLYSEPSNNFPIESIPKVIRDASKEVSRFSKVSEKSPLMVALSAIAVAIGKKAIIEEKDGLTHFPALFFILVAKSGERKTDTFRLMARPLTDWENEKKVEYKKRNLEATVTNEAIEESIKRLKRNLGNLVGKERDRAIKNILAEKKNMIDLPASPRLFSNDITSQNLFQKMHERNGVFAILSGEGREIIDCLAGKYEGTGRTGDNIYLAGISGDKITRDRVGQDQEESKVIDPPLLNVCIFVQPDKFYELISNAVLRSSGAIARIWSLQVPSLVGNRLEEVNEKPLQQSELSPYYEIVKKILDSEYLFDEYGEIIPHKARLSPEAQHERRIIFNEIETKQAEDGELEDVRDIASKTISTIAKLALVIHIAEQPDLLKEKESVIEKEVWLKAQRIGLFFFYESIKSLRKSIDQKNFEEAQRLLFWLAKKNKSDFSIPEIVNICPNAIRQTALLRKMCTTLEEKGWLRSYTLPSSKKSTRYKAHSLLAELAKKAGAV